MQPPALAHPSDDVLVALGSGLLDDATADTVIAHLETCPECCVRASGVPPDSLLQRLRASRGPGDTPPPAEPPPAEAPARTADVPPELLRHEQYEVLRKLGSGGMGVVYLAHNRLTDRPEVLKVIKPEGLDVEDTARDAEAAARAREAAERFLREIRSAARLDHPNIVRALTAFRAGGLVVFVMEYVEGQTLARVVETCGPLPVADACRYARQAALGLQHAFEKGLVHRDIKPLNLILAQGGVVKVLDFGLAKATSEQGGTGHVLTRSGEMFGTPSFMAPEQARDAAKADIRADLYSLGCTLYFLLAGVPPFQASSLYALLHAHQALEAPPLNGARADVPAELAAVVAKLLAKDPAQRYQQPAEVVEALAPFVQPVTKPLAVPAPAVSPGSRPDAATPAPVASASTVGTRVTITKAPEKAPAWQAQPPAAPWSGQWLLVAGVALLLLAVAVGLWAGGVFRLRTPEGILVVEVNEKNPDVYVDGERMTVTWGEGGKTAVIHVRPGTRKVEVKKDGFTVFGDEVELRDGDHRILTARLVSLAPPGPPKSPPAKKVDSEPPPATVGTGRTEKTAKVAKAPSPPKIQPDEPPKSRPEKKVVKPRPAPTEDIAKVKKRPPAAKAPFAEEEAKELQRAWATYLGREVQETVDLGGGVRMQLVLIPPGTFTMGSSEAERDQLVREDKTLEREWFAREAQHEVTITRPFYLAKYTVTRGQFRRFTADADYQTEAETDGLGGWGYDEASNQFKGPLWNVKTGAQSGGTKTSYSWKDPGFAQTDAHPVVNVSWNDAHAFCGWLATRSGRKARLPSEAEWEYACRAGTTTRYFFGDDSEGLAQYANVADGTAKKKLPGWPTIKAEDGYVFTAPVGSFRPNLFSLFDMHGNVWQWCADWYEPSLADLASRDPLRVDKSSYTARVLRGGSWYGHARSCRAACRVGHTPARRDCVAGFRVAFRLD
jgi:formylglycine-generating enzyme required for sulfatase activity/serine/threonine protein kinase